MRRLNEKIGTFCWLRENGSVEKNLGSHREVLPVDFIQHWPQMHGSRAVSEVVG
jgi:hypothetical protein